MNLFKYNLIYNNEEKSIPQKKKTKKPLKVEKLWARYLESKNKKELLPLLKSIRREQQKHTRKNKRNSLYSAPHHLKNLKTNVLVETILKRTFKKQIGDDLSYVLSSDTLCNIETISSTHLLFQCPICLEDDKLVDVILQCGHCLCRSCHQTLATDSSTYHCPICRKDMTIMDKHKGPTLHYFIG